LMLGALAACHSDRSPVAERSAMNAIVRSSHEPVTRQVKVLDSFLFQREAGSGAPIVFLHGNPTSSYVFRNVMPLLSGRHRCLAPDLIGMGQSGKPTVAYRFEDHSRYLDAWFRALDLRELVLVGYDWGGVLALDWAARHPGSARGVVVFETFLRPMHWSDWPAAGAELFRALRTPGVGEVMVLERNEFLARSLENGVKSGLSDRDRAIYYAPFPDAAARRPLLQWPREIPIDGEPAEVAKVVLQNGEWLARSPEVPKLLLAAEGNMLSSPAIVEWARGHVASLDVASLGPVGHHAPEDAPGAIGKEIASWMARHGL
jgi:haloalkane dehalogenase